MVKHWIVVGDASGAKVYESDALLDELQAVTDVVFSHHALPGAGKGGAETEHDPHKLGEERFARAVAQTLNEANLKHRFDRLVVVAPPRFLGDLRAELSHGAAGRVVASIHHDWTKLSRKDLSTQLKKNMPDLAGMP